MQKLTNFQKSCVFIHKYYRLENVRPIDDSWNSPVASEDWITEAWKSASNLVGGHPLDVHYRHIIHCLKDDLIAYHWLSIDKYITTANLYNRLRSQYKDRG